MLSVFDNYLLCIGLQRFTEIVSYRDTFSDDMRIVSWSVHDTLTIQHLVLYIRDEFLKKYVFEQFSLLIVLL